MQLTERHHYPLHLCESRRHWLKLRETESRRIAIGRSQSRGGIFCCRKSQGVAPCFSGLHAVAVKDPACTGQDVELYDIEDVPNPRLPRSTPSAYSSIEPGRFNKLDGLTTTWLSHAKYAG